jgi:hypothetical protein
MLRIALAAMLWTGVVLGTAPHLFAQGPPGSEADRKMMAEFFNKVDQALQRPPPSLGHHDEKLQKLLIDRRESARRSQEIHLKRFSAGARDDRLNGLIDSLTRSLESEMAMSPRPEDQVLALERAVKLAQAVEDVCQGRYHAGRLAIDDLEQSRYHRLDVQIKLIEMKLKMQKEQENGRK